MDKNFLEDINYSEEEILMYRNILKDKFKEKSLNINDNYFNNIVPLDLKILFKLYDEVFFKSFCLNNNISPNFSVSKKLSKVAGKTIYMKTKEGDLIKEEYEIRIGLRFFLDFKERNAESRVCGVKVQDSLEALLYVFEHELCHLLEFYIYKSSNCKRKRFQEISRKLFNHKGIYHELKVS